MKLIVVSEHRQTPKLRDEYPGALIVLEGSHMIRQYLFDEVVDKTFYAKSGDSSRWWDEVYDRARR